jgi:hypothetical protein
MNCDVDLWCRFSHKPYHILSRGVGSGQVTQASLHLLNKEINIMDTKSLDKQGREHFRFYNNFMFATKISIAVIVLTLIIMAATLI